MEMASNKTIKKINFYKLFFLTSLIVISFNLFYTVYNIKGKYLYFDFAERFNNIKFEYLNSQYVSKKPKFFIPDEVINSYAGINYIKGSNPVLIASDTPPLGRY